MMTGLSVLVAAVFTGLAVTRLWIVARWIMPALIVSGLAGGVLAVLHWSGGADSRWLVGGVMLVLGASAAALGARVPAARIVAIVLGVLATLLLGIATATAA